MLFSCNVTFYSSHLLTLAILEIKYRRLSYVIAVFHHTKVYKSVTRDVKTSRMGVVFPRKYDQKACRG